MENLDSSRLAQHEVPQRKSKEETDRRATGHSERPGLLACLLILPSDSEPIVSLLEELAAHCQTRLPLSFLQDSGAHSGRESGDQWLQHAEAAGYLGVSKSTLYRYVCQQKIECRKIAGRLEYRRSSLEKLKNEHIRPARPSHHAGGIIPSAFSSGK
jgi:excisionase family DNA binding protein